MLETGVAYRAFLDTLNREYPAAFSFVAWQLRRLLGVSSRQGRGIGLDEMLSPLTLELLARPRYPKPDVLREPIDVLVTFEPGRDHYLGLFVPVIDELRARGRGVAIMLAPDVKLGPPDFGGAPTFTYTAYATINEYRRARASFARLGSSISRFSEQFRLTPRKRQRLSLLLQSYCWHAEVMSSVMQAVAPRVVLGIHFLGNPGLLGGIRQGRAGGKRAPVLLLQHGYFSTRLPTHDFHGADEVLLWGDDALMELNKFPGGGPPATVVGNPGLTDALTQFSERSSMREPTVLVVGTNGVPRVERQALHVTAQALAGSTTFRTVFRPHPKQNLDVYDELVAASLIERSQVQRQGSVLEAISRADLVVGTESTALLESIVMGVPVVQVRAGESPTAWVAAGLPHAATGHELRHMVDGLMADGRRRREAVRTAAPFARGIVGDPVGAASRAADAIVAAMARPTRSSSAASPTGDLAELTLVP